MTHPIETQSMCDGCGQVVKGEVYENGMFIIDSGFCFNLSGGYNEFNDAFDSRVDFSICHDCVLKFIELFPRAGQLLGPGCHPADNEPCCLWSWTFIKNDEGELITHYAQQSENGLIWVPEKGEPQ